MKCFKITFILLSFIFSQCNNDSAAYKGFTIQGKNLVDGNGNAFIIKGVNNPHIWFPKKAYDALPAIAEKNVNTIRVVWMTQGRISLLDSILSKCIELEMIPMVELHDATGDSSTSRLVAMAAYFVLPEVKHVLDKYEQFLLINIANEWGNHSVSNEKWFEAYKTAVDTLRKAGYRNTIVVDAPGWGQNIDPFIEYGQQLIQYDTLKNILLDVHMYGSWNEADSVKSKIEQVYSLNLPLIIGEFGYNFNDGQNNLGCKVNHKVVMEIGDKYGYGYLPWSWTGNNEENAWLDLVEYNDWKTLTWWGSEVFEGENGISATAIKASIFKTE
ncbi:MAG: cellulase family glycosylhydrolase [Bacteroidales bacterium]|nr:cellulase family glycosylhydrolase [Bacteroidales bacterium]MBN2819529.1 cellulase family glycosylhydrolase [Bacteroidales bacterium]